MRVDLLRFVPFRLNRLAAEVSRQLASVYAARFGIDITEWRVMATLGAGEPRSAGFIVRSTRTHKSKVSRAVGRLTEAGLLEGVADGQDRRSTALRMTAAGRALYAELVPVVLDYEARLLASLAPEDRASLETGLDRLERALGLPRDGDDD